MRLSTKCRYGLRSLIDLALCPPGQPIALKDIAERQGISLKYLEQDFALLKRSGFVRSVKGAKGGYVLARPAEEIRVGEIIKALEGDLLVIDTFDPNPSELRSFLNRTLWNPLNNDVEAYLRSIPLSGLADQFLRASGNDDMLYI